MSIIIRDTRQEIISANEEAARAASKCTDADLERAAVDVFWVAQSAALDAAHGDMWSTYNANPVPTDDPDI